MILKTLEEIQAHKKSVESKGLFSSIIYFLSPITGEVEERHIYADDNAECVAWLEETSKFYKEKNIKHYGYNNSVKTHSYLNPFELIVLRYDMIVQHTKMICDPMELYEARLLEMPFKDGKIDFPNVDFRTLLISSMSIQKAFKVSKKIIKFNKILLIIFD